MANPDRREPLLRRIFGAVEVLAVAWGMAGCARLPDLVSLTPTQIPSREATDIPYPSATGTATATETETPADSPLPPIVILTPTATARPSITPGLPPGFENLTAATITEEAIQVAATMEAGDQLGLARENLPTWYMDNVVSIVFRGGEGTIGYTGLRINAASFIGKDQVKLGYDYYLTVEHMQEATNRTQVTIKDADGQEILVKKANWRFATNDAGMAILAVPENHPAGAGVNQDQFSDLSEWDPDWYAANRVPLKGMCFPYPDNAHPFAKLYVAEDVNHPSVFGYDNKDQVPLIGPLAGAASGCPLVGGGKVLVLGEGWYGGGFRTTPIRKADIADELIRIYNMN